MDMRKTHLEKEKIIRIFEISLAIVICVALFICGYLTSFNIFSKLISEEEFEFYEQVARDIYEQDNKAIYEVPDELILRLNGTSITISSADNFSRGEVVAKLQNGELVFTRNEKIGEAIFSGTLDGLAVLALGLFIFVCNLETYEKIKQKILK